MNISELTVLIIKAPVKNTVVHEWFMNPNEFLSS